MDCLVCLNKPRNTFLLKTQNYTMVCYMYCLKQKRKLQIF